MLKYSLKMKRANAQGGAQDSGCRHRASPKEDLYGLLLQEDHWQSCHVGSLHARLVSMIPHFKSMPQLLLRQRKPSAADQRQQQHALPGVAQPVALAVVCGSLRCIKFAALRGLSAATHITIRTPVSRCVANGTQPSPTSADARDMPCYVSCSGQTRHASGTL